MQIQTIGQSQNFKGKRDNIEAFINLDDKALQTMSYFKATQTVHDASKKKFNNGLMNAVPVIAGLAAAVAMPKLFTKTGRLEKLGQFAKTTAQWFAAFGVIDLVFAAKNKIDNKFDSLREFSKNNPTLSFIGTAGLSLLTIAAARKGFNKLTNKFVMPAIAKNDVKISAKILKLGNKLDNNKFLNNISSRLKKITDKFPVQIKEFGMGILDWAPMLVAIGAITHSANHNKVKNQEFNKNYNELKEKQLELVKMRNKELATQNDFLLTKPENIEDLELLKKYA